MRGGATKSSKAAAAAASEEDKEDQDEDDEADAEAGARAAGERSPATVRRTSARVSCGWKQAVATDRSGKLRRSSACLEGKRARQGQRRFGEGGKGKHGKWKNREKDRANRKKGVLQTEHRAVGTLKELKGAERRKREHARILRVTRRRASPRAHRPHAWP